MISLAEVIQKIKLERDIADEPAVSSFSSFDEDERESPFDLVKDYMKKHPDKVLDILNNLVQQAGENMFPAGETFHSYFTDNELFNMLKDMRDNDTEKFYTIIRYEELFLNTILRLTGKSDAIIHFNIDELF